MRRLFARIADDQRGSFAIETAFVAPVLILMTLGIFEVGTIIARQHELQSAANEIEIIVIATNQGAETDVTTLKSIVQQSVNLNANEVALAQSFRCGTAEILVNSASMCDEDEAISSYVTVSITEQYVPKWTYMGVGGPISFTVNRRVQVS
jgi:Flp pilus assembly protein TadG